MVVRIFYFQLEVSNEASKSCLIFIARTYNIAQSDMLISLFLTRMFIFSDTCDISSLAAKTKRTPQAEPVINHVFA
jgi:hypothetical protein